MVDTDSMGIRRSRQGKDVESLHASVHSWIMEEENDTPFIYWEGVNEYQGLTDPTSLSAKFVDVFPEVKILLTERVY